MSARPVRVGLVRWPARLVFCWACLWPATLCLSAAERRHFDSQRRDGAIVIDARFDDWYGSLQPLGNDPIAIQFLNDADFLYLRLTASDAGARRHVMRQGMTVWFDPGGGTRRKFGVRYPVVERAGAEAERRGGRGGGFGGGRGRRGDGPLDDEAAAPADRVDVIGPGKDDARSLTRDHLSGLDVAIRVEQGLLQYELKVPLARSAQHPYALDSGPGQTIGVGIETPDLPQRSFEEGRGGGFGGGGGGGGMGGGGRGRGGMGGRGGGSRGGAGEDQREAPPKPLKSWATVTIAPVR